MVLVVGDVVAPVGGYFGEGQVGHEVIWGGAVPVFFSVGRVDDVPGAELDGLLAAGCTRPRPSVTWRVWPPSWLCQAVRAPGVKRTAATLSCDGGRPRVIGSIHTSPVKVSAGPLAVGGFGEMSTRCSQGRKRVLIARRSSMAR